MKANRGHGVISQRGGRRRRLFGRFREGESDAPVQRRTQTTQSVAESLQKPKAHKPSHPDSLFTETSRPPTVLLVFPTATEKELHNPPTNQDGLKYVQRVRPFFMVQQDPEDVVLLVSGASGRTAIQDGVRGMREEDLKHLMSEVEFLKSGFEAASSFLSSIPGDDNCGSIEFPTVYHRPRDPLGYLQSGAVCLVLDGPLAHVRAPDWTYKPSGSNLNGHYLTPASDLEGDDSPVPDQVAHELKDVFDRVSKMTRTDGSSSSSIPETFMTEMAKELESFLTVLSEALGSRTTQSH